MLVPNDKYRKWTMNNDFSEESIKSFADELQIGEDILLGRLQHDKIVRFSDFGEFHKKIQFKSLPSHRLEIKGEAADKQTAL